MPDTNLDLAGALPDALDGGLIVLSEAHRITLWNVWLAKASGIRAQDAVGKTIAELFPAANTQYLDDAIAAAFGAGVSTLLTHSLHPQLFPLNTRAGRTLIHDVMVSRGAAGPEAFCLIQIVDVTIAVERDRILRRRQNARYDAVVDSAPDVILTLDADDIIQLANPAALRQFGYVAQELVGKPADVLFPGEAAWSSSLRAIKEGSSLVQPVQMTGRRKDGSATRLEASLSRWHGESRIFITAILRDVNERRAAEESRREAARALADLNATLEQRVTERTERLMHAEEALRQSAKMEAVGRLTGGIAHDFNNLLQGILGSLDRVKQLVAEGRIVEVDRFLSGALASANRAAALTHRLLAFSRRQAVDPRPVVLNDLVRSIEELIRRSIGETIDLTVLPAANLWPVRCDVNQLENALLNLAINARDAMPDGGTLSIETANIVLAAPDAAALELEPGEYVALSVRDSGVGMSETVKSHAFDPFFTTKPLGEGTGLGLSMVYGFIRQSEGGVRLESGLGTGTTVEILLPRYVGPAEEALPHAGSSPTQLAKPDQVVLVVEDEALVRMLIVDVLDELGCHALEAATGTDGLRILQSPQRIDLLVTDIGLPGLNGRQLADAARERRPDLKILFMTGYAETALGRSFLGRGMEIIAKPFDMATLTKRVREIIERAPRS